MAERVLRFGKNERLVGILSEPKVQEHAHNPIVIFLNSGLLHHVGPFRLHVDISRKIVKSGFTSLRFDIGGLGDSAPAETPEEDQRQVILDIQLAMDVLQESCGVGRFVLIGLCTGAANAHRAAVADNRVVGYCALSGYAYPTLEYYIRRTLPVLKDKKRLKEFVKRTISNVIEEKSLLGAVVHTESMGWWLLPPKKQYLKECEILFNRDVKTLGIFTSGDTYYIYERQLLDNIRKLNFFGNVTVKFNVNADHTYTSTEQRIRLIEQIERWICVTDYD